MVTQNLGRVRGNMWYVGEGISGNSSEPKVFPDSGVTKAYAGDLYLNTKSSNVYVCTSEGTSDTAMWSFQCNVKGSQPEVVNDLVSYSKEKALSANMGRELKELIAETGAHPYDIIIDSTDTGYTLVMTIENIDTTITITTLAGATATYEYAASGTSTLAKVRITLGNDIGLKTDGAIISRAKSSNAYISALEIYDESNVTIYSADTVIWSKLNELSENIAHSMIISDTATNGAVEYTRSAVISKLIDNKRTELYPVTHSKAVWYNKGDKITVYDQLYDVSRTLVSIASKTAGAHNGVYRGIHLEEVDIDSIKAGTFDDIYIGDYYIYQENIYRVAAIDPYYNVGGLSKHHIALVPDAVMFEDAMNLTDTTANGYASSNMRKSSLSAALTTFQEGFGDYLIASSQMYSAETTDGKASSHGWYEDEYVRLMSRMNVLGIESNEYEYNADRQFPLFRLAPEYIQGDKDYWLTNIESDTEFLVMQTYGNTTRATASSKYGVRPFALIGG